MKKSHSDPLCTPLRGRDTGADPFRGMHCAQARPLRAYRFHDPLDGPLRQCLSAGAGCSRHADYHAFGRRTYAALLLGRGASGAESRWEARFTPQEEGRYACRFRLSEQGRETSRSKTVHLDVGPAADSQGILHVRDYWTLIYDDGTPFRGVAENICWESRANDDSRFFKALHEQHDKYNYDYMLPLFARNGGNFIRVWMCGFNFPIDQQDHFNNIRYEASDAYYNPSAIARLDHFVGLCERLGIHAMLCMGQGAVHADRAFFHRGAAGPPLHEPPALYRRTLGLQSGDRYVGVLQRDRQHPVPRCEEPDPGRRDSRLACPHGQVPEKVSTLTDTPSPRRFPTGISKGSIRCLGSTSTRSISIAIRALFRPRYSAMKTVSGKPYVIGEFGYEWDWSKNFDDFGADMDRDFRRGLWYGIFSPTPLTPMSWWWEYFENRGMMAYFRGVRQISDRMLADGKGSFEQMTVACNPAEAMGIRCGDVVYVYLYNNSAEHIREAGLTVNLGCNGSYAVEAFDPATCISTAQGNLPTPGRFVLEKITLAPYAERIYIFTPESVK